MTEGPFTAKLDHVANYISEASVSWVGVIDAAQTVTAQLNNVISTKLMKLYSKENASLNAIISQLNALDPSHTKTYAQDIQKLGMKMQVAQKEWDNAINQVQTTAQQQTSQMSAQGNDANQATTSAGLMAQLMQTIVSLLQNSL
jgi:phenylalanyl-tRNA synthetase alpha subunit